MRTPDRWAESPTAETVASGLRHSPTSAVAGELLPRSLYGMNVHDVTAAEALDRVMSWASSPVARVVVTPNTDHFLRWQRSAEFRDLYLGADLSVIDGAPLALLARLEGIDAHRITGADLFMDAAAAAAEDGVPLILVGGQPGVADRAARLLTERFPGLVIPFHTSPSPDDLRSDEWVAALAQELRRHPVKIVALCLGSPKQEQLFRDLERLDPELSGVYLAVGAAIDFASGAVRRAPMLMQRLGVEWMFRLVMEPRRLWRRYLVDDIGIARFLLGSLVGRTQDRLRIALRPSPTSAHDIAVVPVALPARSRLTVAHVGLLGEQPGGMAQVVNGYLAWTGGDIEQAGVLSTRKRRDPRAALLATGAAGRLLALATRGGRSGEPVVAVFHVSEGGSFVREGCLLLLAAALGVPTIAHVHGADFDGFAARHPLLVGAVLRAATAVAVLTDRSAETVRALVGPRATIAVVPNTVPRAEVVDRKRREVLFGGELGSRKGVDVLLEAWSGVVDAHPDWRLVLAGPLAPGFVLPDPLPAGVEVLGAIDHDTLLERLALAEVAVLPSRQEALPMFLLEALAAGCAVIASDAGQVPALLADGAGAVVPAADSMALRAALELVLDDDAVREGLHIRGAARHEERYSTASARPALERFWMEVAGV